MRAYYKQIGILAAIGLLLIAVVFISIALTPLENERKYSNTAKTARLTAAESTTAPEQADLININTAGVKDLQALPDIGSRKAERIVLYRQTHGAFTAKEQIMEVEGIGEKIYENIKDMICI